MIKILFVCHGNIFEYPRERKHINDFTKSSGSESDITGSLHSVLSLRS
jgi:hypothetical protein